MTEHIHLFNKPTSVNSLAEHWILLYRNNRYLKRLSDEDLNHRTADIFSNMCFLADNGKYRPRFRIREDQIYAPIRNLDYLRMATEAWEEARLRSDSAQYAPLDSARLQIAKRLTNESWCRRPDWIVSSRLSLERYEQPRMLFRFSKAAYNSDFIKYGKTHVSPASNYKNDKNNAIKDDELRLHWYDKYLVPQGLEVQDYYVLCLSSEYDYRLFCDFPSSDSCVAINDPVAFSTRLLKAIVRHNTEHPDSRIKAMYQCPVIYVDPFSLATPETVSEVQFCKHFRFAYQTEFRYVFTAENKRLLEPFFLELGSLEDIAEIVAAPENSALTG
jgi:hypothetical protein